MLETQIKVRTESFDGPLSLLLHLIQKQEMSIRDFNLTVITKQYLEYIEQMQQLNFDVAGDFLYMASALVFLKSQSAILEEENILLAGHEDAGPLSREGLIARLEEYQRYQALGKKLWNLPRRDEHIFVRARLDRKAIINSILSPIEISKLTLSMIDLLRKQSRKFQVVQRDRLSIKEKLVELKNSLTLGETVRFAELVQKVDSSDEIVITFICILEMARLRKLHVYQNEPFGEIYIQVKEDLVHFDVDLANGFEPEPTAPETVAEITAEKSSDPNVLSFPALSIVEEAYKEIH